VDECQKKINEKVANAKRETKSSSWSFLFFGGETSSSINNDTTKDKQDVREMELQ